MIRGLVRRSGALPAVAMAAALLTSGSGSSEPPPLWSPPVVDPLRLASLPLSAADAIPMAAGSWRFEASVGYFNVQESTWHAPTIHRDLGLAGEPFTSNEIALLERAFPDDEIYLIDLEGWQVDLRASLGLGRGITVSAHVPWLEVGRPHWDDLAYSVHRFLGTEKDGFEVFPYGETIVYAFRGTARVESLGALERSGWGDLSLAVSGRLGRWLGADHRWSAVVEAPTGDDATLAGSGGWDLGVRWFGRWALNSAVIQGGLGFSHLDPDGGWLGLEREDVWQAQLSYHQRLSAAWSLRFAVRAETSALADFEASDLGDTTLLFDIGARRELGDRVWLGVSFGENLPQVGVTPDYALQLQLGMVLGRTAAATAVGVP